MRDIVLSIILFGALPLIVRKPVYGVFFWVWVSIMNPHRLTYGFAYDLPFALLIAIATMIGMATSREPKHMPWTPATVVLLMFALWMNVTTVFAIDPLASELQWEKVMKIYLMIFVGLYLLHTKKHVQTMIWIGALSIAYFGVKGGVFTLVGGGVERVYGPPGTYIEQNNELALAVVMTIPLLRYLQLQVKKFWVWWGLTGSMVLCGFSVLGSQSRGAFLAISAMLMFLWLKSRNKLVTGLLLVLLVPVAIGFMPESWDKRMRSIETYEEDESAQGRLNAWGMTINLTKDRPLTGGGFEIYNSRVYAKYGPNPLYPAAAHSIYFSMLGEHGYVGLGLFLLFWILVWREGTWVIKHAQNREGWHWASDLARMIQVSLVGFLIGGAFLSLAYYDMTYNLMIALVLTRVLLEKEIREKDGSPSVWRSGPAGGPLPTKLQGTGTPPAVAGQKPVSRITKDPPAGIDSRADQPQIKTDKHG